MVPVRIFYNPPPPQQSKLTEAVATFCIAEVCTLHYEYLIHMLLSVPPVKAWLCTPIGEPGEAEAKGGDGGCPELHWQDPTALPGEGSHHPVLGSRESISTQHDSLRTGGQREGRGSGQGGTGQGAGDKDGTTEGDGKGECRIEETGKM